MLKLTDILNENIIDTTLEVRSTQITPEWVKGFVVSNSSGKAYNFEIQTTEQQNDIDGIGVRCYCSCHDFKFRWAYILHTHGSLLNPNEFVLEAPEKTNPNNKIAVCKHLNTVFNQIKEDNLKKLSARKGVI